MEEEEGGFKFNERNNNLQGLPPKNPTGMAGFSLSSSPPLTLPLLASSSFQGWKKPSFLNQDHDSTSSSISSNSGSRRNAAVGDDPGATSAAADDYSVGSSRFSRHQLDPNMDPKKLRRIISNRVSAQKSRMKKLHYVTEMERKARALEAEIAILQPQVVMFRNQQQLLHMEQERLSQEMSARTNNKLLQDAEIEENKAEVNRLRQLHLTQQQKMQEQEQAAVAAWNKHGIIGQNLFQSAGTGQMISLDSNIGIYESNP